MTNIYILRLEGGKFYVGKSEDPIRRYQEHLNGTGSAWTKRYPPVSLERIIENASPFDEDRYVKEYMSLHGIENVRGGSYAGLTLDVAQHSALQREIWGAKDKCMRCGQEGHFATNCPTRILTRSIPPVDVAQRSALQREIWGAKDMCILCGNKEGHFTTKCPSMTLTRSILSVANSFYSIPSRPGTCYRCGRPGHYSPDCYASRHVRGYELDSDDD